MGRVRTGTHRKIFDLPVRGEIEVSPGAEQPDRVLKRLKGWASKIAGRSYRMTLKGGMIHIQRTPLGMNGRLADWQMMRAGTRLLLKKNATLADERKAKQTADYLTWTKKLQQMDAGKVRYEHQVGAWYAYKETDGNLYAVCAYDVEHGCMTDPNYRAWPIRHLWAGEWT